MQSMQQVYYKNYVVQSNKVYENKINEYQKVIKNQQQTISRLMKLNQSIMQDCTEKIMNKDLKIKYIELKLKDKQNQLQKLQMVRNKITSSYQLEKNQINQSIHKLKVDNEELKFQNKKTESLFNQTQKILELVDLRLSSIAYMEDQNLSANCSEIQSFIKMLNLDHTNSETSFNSSEVMNTKKSEFFKVQDLAQNFEIKFKLLNEKLTKKEDQIKILSVRVQKLEKDTAQLTKLKEQIKSAKQLLQNTENTLRSYRQRLQGYEQVLKKNEEQKLEIARKIQLQYSKINKSKNIKKMTLEQLQRNQGTLLLKIEEVQNKLMKQELENLNLKQNYQLLYEKIYKEAKQLKSKHENFLRDKYKR